jgi:hypothetical protein
LRFDKSVQMACLDKKFSNAAVRKHARRHDRRDGLPNLEYNDSLSITFDLETGRAKWVGLPSLVVRYNVREKITCHTSGCSDREDDDHEVNIPGAVFALGPANVKSSKAIADSTRQEAAEMQQIAKEMQSMAQKAQGMSYEELEKFVEDFEKRHDTDKIAGNMERKVISPDLKATGGDGKYSIRGGGSKDKTEQIENGTQRIFHEVKWQIQRQESAQAN